MIFAPRRPAELGRSQSMIAREESSTWNPLDCGLLLSLSYLVLIFYTLQSSSKTFWSIMPDDKLHGKCITEYNDLRLLFYGGLAFTASKLVLGYVAATKPCGGTTGVLFKTMAAIERLLYTFLLVLTFNGFYETVLDTNLDDIKHCQDMHDTASYFFCASFFVFVLMWTCYVVPRLIDCWIELQTRRLESFIESRQEAHLHAMALLATDSNEPIEAPEDGETGTPRTSPPNANIEERGPSLV